MSTEGFGLFRLLADRIRQGLHMKFYEQADLTKSKKEKKAALLCMLLAMAPFFAVAVAGFALRIEWLCAAGCFLAGAAAIFLYDLRVKPAVRYAAYLLEAHSGLSRQTVGALVRIGVDPVYQDGVWLYEMILNVYEDLSEEGERRFLFDCTKEIPVHLIGQDVALTSHGNFVLDVCALEEHHA